MYLPPAFEVRDVEALVELMQRHPFAALIAVDASGELEITHTPLLADLRDGAVRIEGHVARQNPLAARIEAGVPLTAIFRGPHAYVSPRYYRNAANVPTWNYAVVHAIGRPRVVTDRAAILHHLEAMTARFEAAAPEPWVASHAGDLPERLLPALVAFELVAPRLEAKFKLSQNRVPADREGVLAAFDASGDPDERAVAALMRRAHTG